MRLVVVGAGASFGSGLVVPAPPPLGNQLFGALRLAFPQSWGGLDQRVASSFDASFEFGMGALLSSGSHAVPVLMQHMAIYFAQFRPGPGNAYHTLVETLDHAGKLNDTVFASLNYECLLELALSAIGRRIEYFGAFAPSTESTYVWKLHGSCNFLPGPGITATRGVTYGAGVMFNTSIRAVDPSYVMAYCLGDTALYPAMAHYAPGKAVQIAEPAIRGIQEHYSEACRVAQRVVVIGVRPNMADAHVWEPLASTPAEVLLIGGRDSSREWLARHRDGRRSRHIAAEFGQSIEALVDHL